MRGAFTLALLALEAASGGCGGTAREHRTTASTEAGSDFGGRTGDTGGRAATAGANDGAGRGDSSGTNGGTPGELGGAGTTAATSGIGGASLGGRSTAGGAGTTASAGAPPASGGSESSSGGSAGELAENAGESSGGAGGAPACEDLCTAEAPACCTSELHCVSGVSHCRIDVLAGRIDIPDAYAALEQNIAQLSGEVLFSLSDTDVLAARAEPPVAARFAFDLTPEASVTYGDELMSSLFQPFRLSCDDQELFVGVIYYEDGQAPLETPVLHVTQAADNATVLELGAFEGAWTEEEAFSGDQDAERARIDRPELRAAFCERGILSEFD
jgi:hypothetical protein